jgi:hypothetical protein
MGDIPTMSAFCCGIELLPTLGFTETDTFNEVVGLSEAAQNALLPLERKSDKGAHDDASCWKAKSTAATDSSLSWHYLLEIGGGGSTWHFYSMDGMNDRNKVSSDEEVETYMKQTDQEVTDGEETDVSSGVETAIVSSRRGSGVEKVPISFETAALSSGLGNAVERALIETDASLASMKCASHSDKESSISAIDNVSLKVAESEEKELSETFQTTDSLKSPIEDAGDTVIEPEEKALSETHQAEASEAEQALSTQETAEAPIINLSPWDRFMGAFQPIWKGLLETSEQRETNEGEEDAQRELQNQNSEKETISEACADSFVESSHALYPAVAIAMKAKYQTAERCILSPGGEEGKNVAPKQMQSEGGPLNDDNCLAVYPSVGNMMKIHFSSSRKLLDVPTAVAQAAPVETSEEETSEEEATKGSSAYDTEEPDPEEANEEDATKAGAYDTEEPVPEERSEEEATKAPGAHYTEESDPEETSEEEDEAPVPTTTTLDEPSSTPNMETTITYFFADDYPDLPESPIYAWVAEAMKIRLPSPF